MNKFIVIAAISMLTGCEKIASDYDKHTVPVEKSIIIGTGGVVSSKNTSVLVGPAIVKDQQGSISFFVQKAAPFVSPKFAILSCLVFNAKNQLITGAGANLPSRSIGGTTTFVIPDTDIKGGKVTCQIIEG